jgi:hypothetical protein
MFKFSFRAAALAGVVLAAAAQSAYAGHGGGCAGVPADCCAPAPVCCAPAFRTIRVTEWVPENYECIRTTYKMVPTTETVTCYRTECVTETRTRKVCCNRTVPEVRDVVCTTYRCVPTVETRTVCKKVWKCVPVTTVKRKCVDQGHWECREVPVKEHCLSRLFGGGHGHGGDCCNPCPPCPRTKTVKCWVPCKVWIETPCTRMQRVCENVYETCQVTVNKSVPVQEVRKVTSYRCVTEWREETYTCQVPRKVAYPVTRTVCKCVPVQEKVMQCRMVPRCVEKQVPCDTGCDTGCGGGHKFGGLFGGRGHKGGHGGGCCN